jgi:hypothetical protein
MRITARSLDFRRSVHVGGIVAALVIGIAGLAATVAAQQVGRVTIDFPFVAAGRDMPAGVYQFRVDAGRIELSAQNAKSAPVGMLVITRLGRHDADRDPELIFDKVGDKLMLSEIWLPNVDGYLVLNTPTDHEHRVLGGSRPHK